MTRRSIAIALPWVLAAAIAGWQGLSLYGERSALDREAMARMTTMARMVGEHADRVVEATELTLGAVLRAIEARPGAGEEDRGELHALLESSAEATPAVEDLLFADASGRLLASSGKHEDSGSMGGEAYFEPFLRDPSDRILVTTVRGRASGRWGLMLSRPLHDPSGRLTGVLAAHIGLEKTFLSFYRKLGLSEGTSLALWNEDRVLLLRHPFSDRLIGTQVEVPELASFIAGRNDEAAVLATSPLDGLERAASVRRLAHRRLIVSATQARDEYLASWNRSAWSTAAWALLLMLVCGLLTRYVRRHDAERARLHLLIDAAPIGVVCFDSDAAGRPVPFAANKTARRLLPHRDSHPYDLPDLRPLELERPIAAAAREGLPWTIQDFAVGDGSANRRLDLRVFPVGPGQAGVLIEEATARHAAADALRAERVRWQAAIEETEQGIRDWDIAAGRMTMSARWASQLGYSERELGNDLSAWERLVHPADLPRCRQELERHVAGLSASYRSEHRMKCADGSFRWMAERGRIVVRDDDGRALRLIAVQRDISAIHRLEEDLALWARIFAAAQEGIVVTDADARIVDVNEAYCASTGYSRSQLLGCNPRIMSSGHQPPDFYRKMWAELLQTGIWRGELCNRRADGGFFVQHTKIISVPDRDGQTAYYVGFATDVSELREHQQQIEHLRAHDALTSLPNRQQLAEQMKLAIALAQRNSQLLAVCALDIDHFKPINERWGPEEGDQLLVQVARRLESGLRVGDSLARLGGDEFILLLTGLETPEDCDAQLHDVLERMRQPFERPGGTVRLTVSIGATLYPVDGGDPDTLLRHADQALYAAKQAGRDACQLFDTDQDRRLRMHRRAISEVRAALETGQLKLHYQPKVRLDDGKVVGVEALLRWQHPERGLLMPADFISQINDDALLTAIGEWGLETAVAQAATWHAAGKSIPVSVNVTAGQILGAEFATRLEALLARYPALPPSLLEVEILESAALVDLPRVIALMERCTARGVSFALDDFGTGYASLTYLKHLPVATLKIDQSFVRDILDDSEHRAIVEGVLGLTRVFGRTAIAEGVESIEHGVALIRLGATHAQGYAISGALDAEELPDWIAEWRNPPEWTRASWHFRNRGSGSRAEL